jgi:hypothetical protein
VGDGERRASCQRPYDWAAPSRLFSLARRYKVIVVSSFSGWVTEKVESAVLRFARTFHPAYTNKDSFLVRDRSTFQSTVRGKLIGKKYANAFKLAPADNKIGKILSKPLEKQSSCDRPMAGRGCLETENADGRRYFLEKKSKNHFRTPSYQQKMCMKGLTCSALMRFLRLKETETERRF